MGQHNLFQQATAANPAAGYGTIYFDNAAVPNARTRTPAGFDQAIAGLANQSTVAQGPVAAATRTYLVGSAIAVPPNKLQVGTRLRWTLKVTKTAAGTAASTYDICVGTLGTTGDTARCSFTKPAGTAAADDGTIVIEATVRSIGATGVMRGDFRMTHNLAATGHAVIPCVDTGATSAGFDMTVASLIVGVCVTSGAADALTFEQVSAEAWNI